jgi:hypothetical protein
MALASCPARQVTVTQIGEDGSTRAVGGELAAALAGPVEQFTGMLTWAAEQAGAADHGDREKVIAESGLELQRRLLESTFTIDAGWPIATGMIEGACRFVIEDRSGITGARWSPDGADVILKLRAVVINGDLDEWRGQHKRRA